MYIYMYMYIYICIYICRRNAARCVLEPQCPTLRPPASHWRCVPRVAHGVCRAMVGSPVAMPVRSAQVSRLYALRHVIVSHVAQACPVAHCVRSTHHAAGGLHRPQDADAAVDVRATRPRRLDPQAGGGGRGNHAP